MSGPLLGVAGIAVMFAVLFLLRIPAGFTMAIVGFFGKVIDFGAPTSALSAVAQNTPVTAYLLEM